MHTLSAPDRGPSPASRLNPARTLAILSIVGAFALPAAAQPTQELSVGDISVVVAPRRPGMRVLCGGIEVSKQTELIVTKPPWAPHYYVGPSQTAIQGAQRTRSDGAKILRIEHRGDNDSFSATETLALHPDGRLVQTFAGQLLKPDAEALLQWRMGALNPVILVGQAYTAELADGTSEHGTVPVTAESGDVEASTLAKGFRSIAFDSRIGPLKIEVEPAPRFIVFDHRKNRWASPDNPYFWFGDLGTRFNTGDRIEYRVVYHLPTADVSAAPLKTIRARVSPTPRPNAQTFPQADPPAVIPRPKQATYGDGLVALPVPVGIAQAPNASAARRAAALLTWALERRFGIAAERDHATARIRFAAAEGELPREGYGLTTEVDTVTLSAADERGFLNAVYTLMQLIMPQPDGTLAVRSARIRDWPALPFRGIHLFTGGRGPDLHLKLIRNLLGPLKLNHLVLECEYIEWESHPEIHHPEYGMPKAEVRRILDACAAYGIEVTPLVMALGHCQWIFETGHHLDLAEDPEAKWAYCVTNPKTYEFIFAIYAEALELFQPQWFHIGHDEYTDRGRVPYRESSKPYTVEELFMMDTLRLHGWLKERGVRTMMWGDMLLAKGEAPDACHAKSQESAIALREQLPDDVIIADWHYCGNPPEDFTSLAIFHAAGHETVAATWDRPHNIVNFSQAAHRDDSLGLLQTTWAGYSLDPESFAREMHQYAAYVLAAEAAWNADHPPDPDTYPAKSHFFDLMRMSTLVPAHRAGWTTDLSAAYNYPLAAGDGSGWFGLGPRHDLSGAPAGITRLRGLAFRLAEDVSRPSAIVLRSRLTRDATLPSEVRLELNQPAQQLAILHATSFACDAGAVVGEYELTYDDGSTALVELKYGDNILAYTDRDAAAAAPKVWRGRTAAGQTVALPALIWEHPHPERTIKSLTARSRNAAGALMMLGLTGLDSATATE